MGMRDIFVTLLRGSVQWLIYLEVVKRGSSYTGVRMPEVIINREYLELTFYNPPQAFRREGHEVVVRKISS